MGGELKLMTCGGAALTEEVANVLQVCFCCPMLSGLGATETCGSCTSTSLKDHTTGHAGVPGFITELKLKDVPEMNYLTSREPPQGEVNLLPASFNFLRF